MEVSLQQDCLAAFLVCDKSFEEQGHLVLGGFCGVVFYWVETYGADFVRME